VHNVPRTNRNRNMHIRRKIQFMVWLPVLVVCLAIISQVATGRIRPFLVKQRSMLPTLHPNDYVMTARYSPNGPGPQHGDVVILRDPESTSENEFLVKRVIALPGDIFEVRRGGDLYINGEYVSEPYRLEPPNYYTDLPIKIGEGEYIVLGDNRNHSEDSSWWNSPVPGEQIVGKVKFIYNPLSRMGRVR